MKTRKLHLNLFICLYPMEDESNNVSSEIYEEYNYISTLKPTFHKNNVVSKFEFSYPQHHVTTDEDGDFILPRKNSKLINKSVIEIEHMKSTILDLVGLQIWRGSLLLADWLIHSHVNIVTKDQFILELGAGVGLTSIIASMFAPVICTDINRGNLLDVISVNLEKNKHIVKYPVKVMELDFMSDVIPQEITRNIKKIPIIIAADTVYDDAITDAFIKTIQCLLSKPPQKSVYIALEKRYVFTIADMDSVAPCYEYYLQCLKELKNVKAEEVPLNFPKYFQYERTKELVLWKLTSLF